MFERLGRAVTAHPWRVIGAWILAAIVIVAVSPGLPTSSSESDFLPRHYESIKAQHLREGAFPTTFSPSVVIVFHRHGWTKLTNAQSSAIERIAGEVRSARIPRIKRVVAGTASSNRLVQTVNVQMPTLTPGNQSKLFDTTKSLRKTLRRVTAGTGLIEGTTGSVAENLDEHEASGSAEAIVAGGTIVLIMILLALIFRSPLISILPILIIGVVAATANGLIALLVKAVGLKADSSVSSLLIVVLFGIGTDYMLFLLFRYRERLRMGEDRREAMVSALGRVGEVISSAAGVVIVAFLAMTLSSLTFFRSMGPSMAIAVAVTLLAGLTLAPAVVSLIGPRIFWPSRTWRAQPSTARAAALGRRMARRPALFAAVAGIALIALACGALGFHPLFDLATGSTPKTAESRIALVALERGLPPGATEPTDIYVASRSHKLDHATLTSYGTALRKVHGVGSVTAPKLSANERVADYTVTLSSAPESNRALSVVADSLRGTAHGLAPPGTYALVGGTTSVYVDIRSALNRDYSVVFPVAAIVIMLILALLLRSALAPLYLMLSVGLGFAATLGATTLIFQNAVGKPGLLFLLPLIMYMFVVALGTDYNILIVARLREEARQGHTPREALALAIKHSAPTVAAAGLILAGSFAILMLAGNSLLTEMGFAIAFGILVAAYAMAMFLTPTLTALIGHTAWWPGHGDTPEHDATPAATTTALQSDA